MNAIEKMCPPNIGPDNRLFRLAIGIGALVLVALVSDPILQFILAFACSVATAA